MKSTGVIRRIDELGRIVIPKEIRRTLRIHDGESLEIFVDNEIITLKKYSSLNELANVSKILVESINKEINKDIIITDRDNVIAASGVNKKKYMGKNISSYLENVINDRKSVRIFNEKVKIVDDVEEDCNYIIYPIIANGDAVGSAIIVSLENNISESEEKLIKIVAEFLGKHVEE